MTAGVGTNWKGQSRFVHVTRWIRGNAHITGHRYVWVGPLPTTSRIWHETTRVDLVKQLTRDERQMIDGRRGLTIQFEGPARQEVEDNKPEEWETTLSDTCLTCFASCVSVLP